MVSQKSFNESTNFLCYVFRGGTIIDWNQNVQKNAPVLFILTKNTLQHFKIRDITGFVVSVFDLMSLFKETNSTYCQKLKIEKII